MGHFGASTSPAILPSVGLVPVSVFDHGPLSSSSTTGRGGRQWRGTSEETPRCSFCCPPAPVEPLEKPLRGSGLTTPSPYSPPIETSATVANSAGEELAGSGSPRSARFMGSERNRANTKPRTALSDMTATIHAMIGPR